MHEKKKFLYLECTFNVEFISMKKEKGISTKVKNNPPGGICILTDKPLPDNQNCFIKFYFPDRLRSYNIQGRTIWSKQVRDINTACYENGIEIMKNDKDTNELLSDNIVTLRMEV